MYETQRWRTGQTRPERNPLSLDMRILQSKESVLMRKLSAALDRNQSSDEEKSPQDNGRCSAPGCPLSGTMSHDTHGHHRWYCNIHFGRRDPTGMITSNIVERKALIEMARRGLNMALYDWETTKHKLIPYMTHHQRLEFIPRDDETAFQWAERVLTILKDECINHIRQPVPSWQDGF